MNRKLLLAIVGGVLLIAIGSIYIITQGPKVANPTPVQTTGGSTPQVSSHKETSSGYNQPSTAQTPSTEDKNITINPSSSSAPKSTSPTPTMNSVDSLAQEFITRLPSKDVKNISTQWFNEQLKFTTAELPVADEVKVTEQDDKITAHATANGEAVYSFTIVKMGEEYKVDTLVIAENLAIRGVEYPWDESFYQSLFSVATSAMRQNFEYSGNETIEARTQRAKSAVHNGNIVLLPEYGKTVQIKTYTPDQVKMVEAQDGKLKMSMHVIYVDVSYEPVRKLGEKNIVVEFSRHNDMWEVSGIYEN